MAVESDDTNCSKCGKKNDAEDDNKKSDTGTPPTPPICNECCNNDNENEEFVSEAIITATASPVDEKTLDPKVDGDGDNTCEIASKHLNDSMFEEAVENLINNDEDCNISDKEIVLKAKDIDNSGDSLKQRADIACVAEQSSPSPMPAATAPITPKEASPAPVEIDAEPDITEQPTNALEATESAEEAPMPVNRSAKFTRSSLNGKRTPTVLKRLRKSTRNTRNTRFKTKLTSRSSAAGNSSTNGLSHTNGSVQTQSFTTHPNSSASSGRTHSKATTTSLANAGGPRNRRALFKRIAQKTPKVQSCSKFVKSIFYKGSYMQIGDIVSIVDSEYNIYYAQIRGLLVDAYCEKSAYLTWLIPTQDSPDPKKCFDPATYLIGPDEEQSRKLCYLEFVMHAPSNYYYDRTTPFPMPDVSDYIAHRAGGYVWTRLPLVKRESRPAVPHAHKATP